MDDVLERQLRDYLIDRQVDKDAESTRHEELKSVLRTVSDQVLRIDERVQRHELDDERRHGEVLLKLGDHATRIGFLEDAEETSGVHDLEQLKELAREATFWKRWLLGIIAALIVAGVAGGVQLVAAAARH